MKRNTAITLAAAILSLPAAVNAFILSRNLCLREPKSRTDVLLSTLALKEATNDNDLEGASPRRNEQETFLEQASIKGSDKMRLISIEERTKRAMLAEAVEDRMVEQFNSLEELLDDDGMPLKIEYRDEVEVLAKEIKASREQYQRLVSGEPSSVLEAFNSEESDEKSV